jgi:hypothetical protein
MIATELSNQLGNGTNDRIVTLFIVGGNFLFLLIIFYNFIERGGQKETLTLPFILPGSFLALFLSTLLSRTA